MKVLHKIRLKKTLSSILAAAMSLSLFTAIPVSADIGRTTYNYDGYSVDYNIKNEWDGAQTVELTVSNTGTDSILNWSLKYDTEGEISNLWNADLYEQNGDEYIIKNVGWNFEIAPNQSVTYGYTLSGNDLTLPDSFEIYSKRVDKTDGYDVQYNITNSWDIGVEGNIVITNTSAAPIEAWTLSFDSNFTIDNLWNGRVLENNGTSYTVAAEMWTNPIQPNGSMTIGFVGSKTADVEALLSNFRLTEVVIGEGMPVIPIDPPVEEIEITANAVYDEENDNITVSWNTNNPNGTFDIFMSSDGENFISVGTVDGVSEFVYVPENDFETLYFKVVQTVGEQTAESNIVAVSSDSEAIVITAKAIYDEENDNTIIVEWTSNNPNGIFEVMMSDDGENFISVSKEENISKYAYTYEDDFNVLYFKVKQTVGVKNAESNTAKIVFYIDWEDLTDTDSDGLSDVYEKYYYETDPLNPDTDSDGLPDGYEVLTLGTDPAKADADDNGISDANEDFDEDGLSNFEEYQLETDPLNKDTDNDGLSDYDEINTYNTDPLEYDTDGDIVSDGDEIALGLNPLSPVTNGIPDNERTFEQTIDSDNLILYFVNTEVNPFEVSLKVNAAGVAENNLEAEISGYNYIMKNEAILGVAPAFSYTDGLKVEDVVINFDLDNSVTANTNGKYTGISEEFVGIKRFNVFRYFEDTNMLLPIETFHNVENNRIYANTDELGTYCLVDMEIWLDSLGITPEAQQASIMPLALSDTGSIKVKNGDNLDVVFVLYSSATYFEYMKSEIITTADEIFKEAKKQNVSVRIHYVTWTGDVYLNANTGEYFAENLEDVTAIIKRSVVIDTTKLNSSDYVLTKSINGIRNAVKNNLQENSKPFCFIIDAGCHPTCSSTHYGIQALQEQGFDFSFIYAPGNYNVANYKALSSNNSCYQFKLMPGRMAFSEYVFDHIFDKVEEPVKIISAAGLTELPEDFGEISTTSEQDYDNDGLLDVQEIYFDVTDKNGNLLVTVNNDGSIELPSFNKCVSVGGTYVEQGLKRFYDEADESILSQLDEIKVLPILADPTSEDGDGDGILDFTEFEDIEKSIKNVNLFSKKATNNGRKLNPLNSNTIIKFCKDVANDVNGKIKIEKNLKDIFNSSKEYGPYNLANEMQLDFEKTNRSLTKYGVIGNHYNPYYLEFYCKLNNENTSVEKNYLGINVNLKFSKNLYDKSGSKSVVWNRKDGSDVINESISADEIIDKIKKEWSNTYIGTNYDFYNNMKLDVKVYINIIVGDEENTKRIITNSNETKTQAYNNNVYRFVEFNLTEYNSTKKSLTSGISHSNNIMQAKPVVTIFTEKSDSRNNGITDGPQNKNNLLSDCAHEFGHVLGLMDAYAIGNFENYYMEPVSFAGAEIEYNSKYYGTEEAGEMMHRSGKVSTNDIEMVVYAKISNKRQFYVPIGFVLYKDGTKSDKYTLSKAIKANYIYYAKQGDDITDKEGNLICTTMTDKYYYFKNGVYEEVKSDTKVEDFTEFTTSDKEYNIYANYLGYVLTRPNSPPQSNT